MKNLLLLPLILLIGLVGCTTISDSQQNPDTSETNKIKPTETAVPPIATAVPPTSTSVPPTNTRIPPTATIKPTPFILKEKAFEANILETCNTDIAITDVVGDGLMIEVLSGTLSIRQGGFTVWCYGAKHTWMGSLVYDGYTFISDNNNPLQFMIEKDRGYVYLKGSGSVTYPDGKVIEFP